VNTKHIDATKKAANTMQPGVLRPGRLTLLTLGAVRVALAEAVSLQDSALASVFRVSGTSWANV